MNDSSSGRAADGASSSNSSSRTHHHHHHHHNGPRRNVDGRSRGGRGRGGRNHQDPSRTRDDDDPTTTTTIVNHHRPNEPGQHGRRHPHRGGSSRGGGSGGRRTVEPRNVGGRDDTYPTAGRRQRTNNNDTNNNNNNNGRSGGRRPHGRGGRGGGGGRQNNNNHNQSHPSDNTDIPSSSTPPQNDEFSGRPPNNNVPVADKSSSKSHSNKNKPKKTSSKSSGSNSGGNIQNKDSTNPMYAAAVPPNQPQQTSNINYGKGETITILHVAEKPSIAQAIAKGLVEPDHSGGGGRNNNNNNNKSLPVHEFTTSSQQHPFPKAPYASKCLHKVTSVVGHVFSVDFPKQYQSWESVDPAELFDAPVVRAPNKTSVVRHLQDEARNVNFIVLWMDCDREGENINFEVLECCLHLMKSSSGDSNYDRVYRAYFSAINPSDIKKAYQALGKPDQNQALAVDARQELDLKIGVAFSRFQTRFFQGRYGDLDSAVLSYGPCQTPTLGFCVQRHIDIETFKPEPYWVLELNIMKRGRNLKAVWSSGRSFNKSRVEQLLKQALENDPFVQVRNVVVKEKKQGRPIPLNTVALLKACSKALGIGPHAAMQTAERLYLSGYLSYPRTESTTYPKSFDVIGTLRQQAEDNRWGTYVRALLQSDHQPTPRGGVDMGDHPPITPCRPARSNELSGDMALVFELVVRHFIASVSPDAVWKSTRVTFGIESLEDKGEFAVSGKELVSPGFLAILLHKEYGNETSREGLLDEYDHDEEEIAIPDFTKGEVIPVLNTKSQTSSKLNVTRSESAWSNIEIKERMTTPPTYLTESELIGMMEKHGIGTDASIATHIENVQKRNYVAIATGRRLIPSKLGLVLVQGYHQIDSTLVLPQVRSDIESQCNKIALGQASKEAVVRAALDLFRHKYDVFVKCIDKMDVLFGSSFLKLEEVGKPFTRCGYTRRYLTYIPGPPPRLYNKWTESVYPLPSGGIVKQWTGKHCPVEGCHFELCLYSVGQPERTFPLCPRCYNDVDFALDPEHLSSDPIDRADEGKEREIRKMVAGRALVLECPLPDHHPSITELTVSPNPDGGGVFIVDPHLGPKWRFVATRQATMIHLPSSIARVTVLSRTDDVLPCRLIQVEFKEGESPREDGKLKHTCCFANDELLQGMVRVHYGSDRLKATGRGRGGRGGRGSSRGGRSSGRGRR